MYSYQSKSRRITPELFRTNRSSCVHCDFTVRLVLLFTLRLRSVRAHRSPFKIVHLILFSVCQPFTHNALCVCLQFVQSSLTVHSSFSYPSCGKVERFRNYSKLTAEIYIVEIFNFEILNDFIICNNFKSTSI